MTRSSLKRLMASRIVRIALLCTILIVLALAAFAFDRILLGLLFVSGAIAIAVAYFLFIIRPARIPRDAILVVRLNGALPEEPHRSLIDQFRGRTFPALSHLRQALEEVRTASAIRAVVIEAAGVA